MKQDSGKGPSILFIDSAHPSLLMHLNSSGFRCELHDDWSLSEISEKIHEFDGIVIRSRITINREIIDKGNRLKFIARVGSGMENIDVSYATEKGIKCLHSPEGNRVAVGEHALGMLLCLLNNICRADSEVRQGKWLREQNRGIELKGKTVGIIGFGNTGSAFAGCLSGLGCEILAFDKYKTGFSGNGIKESNLESVFKFSDVLSLHVPLTPETKYYINDEFISGFYKPFYIINTSRGENLNTEDLVKNMKSGKVLGACLDVIEYESLSFEEIRLFRKSPSFEYLLGSSKTVLSPHIAGWTRESNEKMAEILAGKIKSVFMVS